MSWMAGVLFMRPFIESRTCATPKPPPMKGSIGLSGRMSTSRFAIAVQVSLLPVGAGQAEPDGTEKKLQTLSMLRVGRPMK